MTPAKLSELLAFRAEAVCRHLLPTGRRKTAEWVVGDLGGGKGESLKVRIGGDDISRIGVWSDFATGESGADLLDLWCATRRIGLKQAMAEVEGYLGVKLDGEASRPQRTYRQPPKPHCERIKPNSPTHGFLTSRHLTDETIAAYRLATSATGEIIFPYLKTDGRFVNAKYRKLPKTFRQEAGAEPCLFGWQVIESHYPRARWCVITEGELDTMSLHQLGIPALSVPAGGGNGHKHDWIESDFDELQRFDLLYLCLDMDEPGRQATDELMRRLGVERCRLVELPYPWKDANEALMAGMTGEQFRGLLAAAKTRDPDELKSAVVFTEAVLMEFDGEKPGKPPIGVRSPWTSTGRKLMFRPGETTLWFGYSGHGKSGITNHVAAFALTQNTRWCIASMEMPPRKTLHRLICQLLGTRTPSTEQVKGVMGWLGDKLWLFDVAETTKADRMLAVFDYATKRYDIRHYVVDSFTKCGIDEDDFNGQKKLMDRITDMARKNDCHVHVVCHARKGDDERDRPNKHDVRGATAITDMADNVISVWRDKDAEDRGQPLVEVEVHKQRHFTWEGRFTLDYHETTFRFLDNHDDLVSYLPDLTQLCESSTNG